MRDEIGCDCRKAKYVEHLPPGSHVTQKKGGHVGVFNIYDRSVNLGAFPPKASLYALCRAWIQDDPARQVRGAALRVCVSDVLLLVLLLPDRLVSVFAEAAAVHTAEIPRYGERFGVVARLRFMQLVIGGWL